jgi:hypothetical protein
MKTVTIFRYQRVFADHSKQSHLWKNFQNCFVFVLNLEENQKSYRSCSASLVCYLIHCHLSSTCWQATFCPRSVQYLFSIAVILKTSVWKYHAVTVPVPPVNWMANWSTYRPLHCTALHCDPINIQFSSLAYKSHPLFLTLNVTQQNAY